MQAPTGPASKGGKKGGKKGKGRKGKAAAAAAASAEDTEGADMPQAAPMAAAEPLEVPGQPHAVQLDVNSKVLTDITLQMSRT